MKGRSYLIHYNRERPYLVNVQKDNVYIYKRPNKNLESDKENYTKLVKKYKPINVFVGKSHLNNMTRASGAHGKGTIGNSILLQLSKYKYVIIQDSIEEFKTPNDEIIKFISPIGNNDVPYPMAFGKKYVYNFVDEISYINKKDFNKGIYGTKPKDDYIYRYFELQPFFIGKKGTKPKIPLDEFREIMKESPEDISKSEILKIAKMYNVTTNGSKEQLINRLESIRRLEFKD